MCQGELWLLRVAWGQTHSTATESDSCYFSQNLPRGTKDPGYWILTSTTNSNRLSLPAFSVSPNRYVMNTRLGHASWRLFAVTFLNMCWYFWLLHKEGKSMNLARGRRSLQHYDWVHQLRRKFHAPKQEVWTAKEKYSLQWMQSFWSLISGF